MVNLNYESPGGPRSLRGPDREWERIADSLGARFTPANASPTNCRRLCIPAHPWTIIVDPTGGGFLRACASYVPTDALRLRIDLHELPMGRFRRLLVRPFPFRKLVQVGVPLIDERTFIQCADSLKIRRLLVQTALGATLLQQRSGILRAQPCRDVSRTALIRFYIPFGSSPGEFDAGRFIGAVDVVRATLDQLMETGSAIAEVPAIIT